MVRPDQLITCPACEHAFRFSDVAVWHVCTRCGYIWPPGEDWRSHLRDPTVECNAAHAIRKYSESDALDKQAEVRSRE